MESKTANEEISVKAEADVPVDIKLPDEHENPEKQESNSAVDKDTPQNHDILVLATAEVATHDVMGVKQPEGHEKPEETSETNVTAEESTVRSNNDLPELGTAAVDPQLSENTDIKLLFVCNPCTTELAQQVSEPMETGVTDQVGLMKSQPEMDKPVDDKLQQVPETTISTGQCHDTKLVTAVVDVQLSEPMEMSASDQVGLLISQSEMQEQVHNELSPQNEKPEEPETTNAPEKPAPQSLEVIPVLGTAEPMNPNLLDEREKPEATKTNSFIENNAVLSHDVPGLATLEANLQLNEAMDTQISDDEEELCSSSQKKPVDKGLVSPVCGGGGSLALLSMQYRDDSSEDLSDSDSDSSSSTSSSSSSTSSGVVSLVINELEQDEDQDGLTPGKKQLPLKTQDELLIEDLPAVETLSISLPEDTEIEPIGVISSVIDQLVIVESKKDSQPLNDDSVLFNKDRLAVGRVFEVFGPVCQPYYILRFNSKEDIGQRNLKIGEPIFFAPKIKDFTEYIFTEDLNKFKGSDASWKNDQEPPPEALDFSDDEVERLAKHKLKEQRRQQKQQQQQSQVDSDSEEEMPTGRPRKPPRRKQQNQNPQRDIPAYHNPHSFRNSYHTNPHFQSQDRPGFQPQGSPRFHPQGSPRFQPQGSPHFHPQGNPHFQPDYMFPPPDPFHPPFQGPSFAPFPGPPPPPMGMGPWAPGPYPGMMFHLPPPPPPPPPPSSN